MATAIASFDLASLAGSHTCPTGTWDGPREVQVTVTRATSETVAFRVASRPGESFLLRREMRTASDREFFTDRLALYLTPELTKLFDVTLLLPLTATSAPERYTAAACGVVREDFNPLHAAVAVMLNTL